ncbi:hypothetical protein OIO90_005524 [Microbotryomycetes sp. JL221]|nr:hypothetical protein OIO90_005524 [Microbotryomycetes sp. JL221]
MAQSIHLHDGKGETASVLFASQSQQRSQQSRHGRDATPWLPVVTDEQGNKVIRRRKSIIAYQERRQHSSSSPPPSPTRKLRNRFGIGDDDDDADDSSMSNIVNGQQDHTQEASLRLPLLVVNPFLPPAPPSPGFCPTLHKMTPACIFPLSPPATAVNTPKIPDNNPMLRKSPSLSRLWANKTLAGESEPVANYCVKGAQQKSKTSLRRRSTTALLRMTSRNRSTSNGAEQGCSNSLVPPLSPTKRTDLFRSQSDGRTNHHNRSSCVATQSSQQSTAVLHRELGVLSETEAACSSVNGSVGIVATGLGMLMITNPDDPIVDELGSTGMVPDTDTEIGLAL